MNIFDGQKGESNGMKWKRRKTTITTYVAYERNVNRKVQYMHFAFFVFVTLDTTREENVININMLVLRAIKT